MVVGDLVYAVLEGEATVVAIPLEACTPAGVQAVAGRVGTAQQQRAWKEATFRIEGSARRSQCAPRRADRGGASGAPAALHAVLSLRNATAP